MAVEVKKINKAEIQEALEHYWELFRKEVTLPNDPSVVGYTKSVFEAGFWAALVDIFGTEEEPSTEKLSATIHINVNHDQSKAN